MSTEGSQSPGRHRPPLPRWARVLALASAVVGVVAVGFGEKLGGNVADALTKDSRQPLFQITVDNPASYGEDTTPSWFLPPGSAPPGLKDCEGEIGKWGMGQRSAIWAHQSFKVRVTSPIPGVIIESVRLKVIRREPAPGEGWLKISCPVGGALGERTATIDFQSGKTSYSDADGTTLKGLNYGLAQGEAGVFYIQQEFRSTGQEIVYWHVEVGYSVNNEAHRVDLNETLDLGDFKSANIRSCRWAVWTGDTLEKWVIESREDC